MTHESMTVHKALAELKILDSRIDTAIVEDGAPFVMTKKHSADKVNGKSLQEIKEAATGRYDKITDLIARRKAIKQAIALSNAKTTVEICGHTYSVAEAIEYKNSGIKHEENLLVVLRRTLERARISVADFNDKQLPTRTENFIESLYGSKDVKANGEAAINDREKFIEQNSMEVFDPIDIAGKVEALEEFISNFKAEVDAALSVSNALTVIEIEY